jgi:putative transposase
MRIKQHGLSYSTDQVCRLFDMSRQAYYKHQHACLRVSFKEQIILDEVRNIRHLQPRIGVRKLHYKLKPILSAKGITIGRDRLFELLKEHKLLIVHRKRYVRTTQSYHRFRTYRNLIKDMTITGPNQVFVADITYLETTEGFCYLALITDAYSRKIVGYSVSQSLSIEFCLDALKQALTDVPMPDKLIHHSDRGIQYCSAAYVGRLQKCHVKISMTEQNHVYENALAERVNGILKTEFMLGEKLASYAIAKELVRESIKIYNEQRPHLSLNYLTPHLKHAA